MSDEVVKEVHKITSRITGWKVLTEADKQPTIGALMLLTIRPNFKTI